MQFTCLPQGLGPASRTFTKILKPVLAHLRSMGLNISTYIDDSFCVLDDDDEYDFIMLYAAKLLDKLGFTINIDKSVLPPTRTKIMAHLGFVFNSIDMTVQLTPAKQDCISALAGSLLNNNKPTIQQLAQFIGKLVAAEPGYDYAPLYYKNIEIFKNQMLSKHKGKFDAIISLPAKIREDIAWWGENVYHVKRHVIIPSPGRFIESDASKLGWGGITDENLKARGQWSADELGEHINYRELLAAFFMLMTFCANEKGTHIRLKLDNTTAVACINRKASNKVPLMELTKRIWQWALERNIILSAEYLPGLENATADAESRAIVNNDIEWMLKKHIFETICDTFSKPDIDLFATRINTQLPLYFAWKPDPEALAIDAFMQPWTDKYCYIFPPFRVIGRILQKVAREEAEVLLIAPVWPTQSWWSAALMMAVEHPRLLPAASLTLPQNPQLKHPLQRLKLCAMRLSGKASRQQVYRRTLSKSFPAHGEKTPTNNMPHTSRSGQNFACKGKSVPFLPL